MTEVRVLIAAADPLVRAGLAALLAGQPECRVVGLSAGGRGLAEEVGVFRPEVVALDLGWAPPADLLTLPEESVEREDLHRKGSGTPQVPILALLPNESRAAEAWTAGVRGILPREAGAETLVAYLQAVAQGLVVLDPVFAAGLLSSQDQAPGSLVEDLTPASCKCCNC